MSDVTRILSAIDQGDRQAAGQLLPLVYEELRQLAAARLAQERPGQTLEATALVHEAYLRLVGAAAAEAMRRILIDRARDKGRLKRGGGWKRLQLDWIELPAEETSDGLLEVDTALEKLAHEDPLAAELVKLRFFAGLTLDDAARALDMAPRTADRYWAFARSWLYEELRRDDPEKNLPENGAGRTPTEH